MSVGGSPPLLKHIGPGDVRRHQVRSELDALEFQIQNPRQGRHQERLRQSGDAHQHAMSPGEEADQQFLNHPVLSHNGFRQFPANGRGGTNEIVDQDRIAHRDNPHSVCTMAPIPLVTVTAKAMTAKFKAIRRRTSIPERKAKTEETSTAATPPATMEAKAFGPKITWEDGEGCQRNS